MFAHPSHCPMGQAGCRDGETRQKMEQVFQGQMGDLNMEGGSGASYSQQDLRPALPCLRQDTASSWALLSRAMPLTMVSKLSKCECMRQLENPT